MKSIGISIFLYFVSSICLFGQWTDNPAINSILCKSKKNIINIIKNNDSAFTFIKNEYLQPGKYIPKLQCVDNQGHDKWSINIRCSNYGLFHSLLKSDGNGGIFIVINNLTFTSSNTLNPNDGIIIQRLNSEGKYLWDSKGIAVCNTRKKQFSPQIVGDGLGGALVVWQDGRNIDTNSSLLNQTLDIYAQRINNKGERLWGSDGVAIFKDPSEQSQIQLLTVGETNTIIVWSDSRHDNRDIYAQCIDTSGKVKWAADGIAVCDADNSQDSPQLISDNCGGCIIVWSDSRGDNRDIYAQRLNNQGIPLWDKNGIVVCDADYLQNEPRLISDGYGGAVITWEDQREQYTDVYAQRINSDGKAQWKINGIPICNAKYYQNNPQIIKTGKDTFKIFWEDSRFEKGDIFSQEVSIDGTIKLMVNGEIICTGNKILATP